MKLPAGWISAAGDACEPGNPEMFRVDSLSNWLFVRFSGGAWWVVNTPDRESPFYRSGVPADAVGPFDTMEGAMAAYAIAAAAQ